MVALQLVHSRKSHHISFTKLSVPIGATGRVLYAWTICCFDDPAVFNVICCCISLFRPTTHIGGQRPIACTGTSSNTVYTRIITKDSIGSFCPCVAQRYLITSTHLVLCENSEEREAYQMRFPQIEIIILRSSCCFSKPFICYI